MSVELFNGLVSPEIAGVLDEAMRAMPDSAVHVTPGRYGSGRVHVSIGGGSYDLSLTIDGGDRVASLELVPVGGRTGNAVAVLRAGLGVLAAAEGTDTRDVWILDEGCEARWDKITGRLVIECEHTCGQPGSIRSIDAIKQNPGDDRWVVNALPPAPDRAQRVRGIPGVGLRTADGREWLRWGPGFIWHRPATVMTPRGWVIARCHHQAGEFIPLAEDDRSYELGCRWDVCEDCPTCTS